MPRSRHWGAKVNKKDRAKFLYVLGFWRFDLVAKLCLTLSDPVDCSPPGSSVHGIFQARVLEWGAIAFSETMLSELYI